MVRGKLGMAASCLASSRADRGRRMWPAGVQSLVEEASGSSTAGTWVQRRSRLAEGIGVARPEATGQAASEAARARAEAVRRGGADQVRDRASERP